MSSPKKLFKMQWKALFKELSLKGNQPTLATHITSGNIMGKIPIFYGSFQLRFTTYKEKNLLS